MAAKITGLKLNSRGQLVEVKNKWNNNSDDKQLVAALKRIGKLDDKQFGFDSTGEKDYGAQLELQVRTGQIKDFDRQVRFDLFVFDADGRRHNLGNHMRVDFVIERFPIDGQSYSEPISVGKLFAPAELLEVLEYKGPTTPEFLLKKKLFPVCYPHITYTIAWHGKQERQKRKWPKRKLRSHQS